MALAMSSLRPLGSTRPSGRRFDIETDHPLGDHVRFAGNSEIPVKVINSCLTSALKTNCASTAKR